MARLTQTQLAGFRIGADDPADNDADADGPRPRRASQAEPVTRPSSRRAPPASVATTPETDHPSPLGPVPPALKPGEARHKIGLTLPLDLADRVRTLTREGYALADLVMVAYQNHRDQLVEEHAVATPRRLIARPPGRTPITIALSNAEHIALDILAERLGWTRSHTVAALLDLQIESMR